MLFVELIFFCPLIWTCSGGWPWLLHWAGLVGRQFCLCFSFMIYIKSGHNEAICSRSGSVLRHIGQMSQDLSKCSKSRKISKKNRQKGVILRVSKESKGHGIMGTGIPAGGLLRYRKWVPQQLGDVIVVANSPPIGLMRCKLTNHHLGIVLDVRAWS